MSSNIFLLMKNIYDLSNPDLIEINEEEYQVIENTSHWWDSEKDELIMILYLIKVGEEVITATHYITYINEDPGNLERWKFVKIREPGAGILQIKSIDIIHT